MSGLYNAVFGHHRTAPLVLFSLQKPPQYFGRFRDAWVERLQDGTLRFAVYTRNGGGNRLHAGDDPPKGPDCACSGCVMEYVLPNDPQYLSDQDDDYDSPYATVYFSIPANAKERLLAAGAPPDMQFETVAVAPPNMRERWTDAIAAFVQIPPTERNEPEGEQTGGRAFIRLKSDQFVRIGRAEWSDRADPEEEKL